MPDQMESTMNFRDYLSFKLLAPIPLMFPLLSSAAGGTQFRSERVGKKRLASATGRNNRRASELS